MAKNPAEKFLQKPEKIEKVPVNVNVMPEVSARLDELSKERDMSKGDIVSSAINMLYEALKGK